MMGGSDPWGWALNLRGNPDLGGASESPGASLLTVQLHTFGLWTRRQVGVSQVSWVLNQGADRVHQRLPREFSVHGLLSRAIFATFL